MEGRWHGRGGYTGGRQRWHGGEEEARRWLRRGGEEEARRRLRCEGEEEARRRLGVNVKEAEEVGEEAEETFCTTG
jgi:hypothetical protein